MNIKTKKSYYIVLLLSCMLFLTGCGVKIRDIFQIEDGKTTKEVKDPYDKYKDSNEEFVTINGDVKVGILEYPSDVLNKKENEIIEKMKQYGYKPISVTSSASPNYDRNYLYTILFEKIKD